jgi:sugar phosphate isomerase/epimerase
LIDKAEHLDVYPIYHGNFKNPIASDVPELRSAAMGYLKSEIDLSAKIGAPLIVHAGGIVEPRKVKTAKSRALDGFINTMKEAYAYADAKGVELWMENLSNYQKFHPFYYILTNLEEYLYVIEALDNPKIILDVCHETVGGGDPIEVFLKINEYVAAFSFSDTLGDRDSHSPLGKGVIDYPRLLKEIYKADWQGVVAFETRGVDPRANLKFLNQIIDSDEYLAQTA